MARKTRTRSKGKQRCCEKPPRKACKDCPRRRPGAELGPPRPHATAAEPELPPCPLASWPLA